MEPDRAVLHVEGVERDQYIRYLLELCCFAFTAPRSALGPVPDLFQALAPDLELFAAAAGAAIRCL